MTELMTPLPDDCKALPPCSIATAAASRLTTRHSSRRFAGARRSTVICAKRVRISFRIRWSSSVAATWPQMAELAAAIEDVVALPAWQGRVLGWAPASARVPACARRFPGLRLPCRRGWPKLIEINTNAGGGLLNARLASAQRACCDPSLP